MDLSEKILAIVDSGLIPVMLKVLHPEDDTVVNEYLMGCYSVPRNEEFVEYDERLFEVIDGYHRFSTQHVLRKTMVPIQLVTISVREFKEVF